MCVLRLQHKDCWGSFIHTPRTINWTGIWKIQPGYTHIDSKVSLFFQLMTQQRELPPLRHTLQTRLEPLGQREATIHIRKNAGWADTETHTGVPDCEQRTRGQRMKGKRGKRGQGSFVHFDFCSTLQCVTSFHDLDFCFLSFLTPLFYWFILFNKGMVTNPQIWTCWQVLQSFLTCTPVQFGTVKETGLCNRQVQLRLRNQKSWHFKRPELLSNNSWWLGHWVEGI